MAKSNIHFDGNHIQLTTELRKVLFDICNEGNFSDEVIEVEQPPKKWVFRFYRR